MQLTSEQLIFVVINYLKIKNLKKDASMSSNKWKTYRKKRKLAAYVRNKNILCFRIEYIN